MKDVEIEYFNIANNKITTDENEWYKIKCNYFEETFNGETNFIIEKNGINLEYEKFYKNDIYYDFIKNKVNEMFGDYNQIKKEINNYTNEFLNENIDLYEYTIEDERDLKIFISDFKDSTMEIVIKNRREEGIVINKITTKDGILIKFQNFIYEDELYVKVKNKVNNLHKYRIKALLNKNH